jgi:DNA-nicking Smr family endonuclease
MSKREPPKKGFQELKLEKPAPQQQPEKPAPPPPPPPPKAPPPPEDDETLFRAAVEKGPPPQQKKARAGGGFNMPFKGLKLDAPPPPAPKGPPPKPPEPKRPPPSPTEEEELFAQAMAGVERLKNRGTAPDPTAPEIRVIDDEAEALAQLAELVSGQGEFDISDSDEFIEGSAPDLDRRVLRALKRGDYAVQGRLDLHGMTRVEAREAVEQFLTNSRRDGKRCVLLVHGRGLNSKDQIPVLKEQLKVWLNRGRIARGVLAFATARPHDGGAGALYVLLRR